MKDKNVGVRAIAELEDIWISKFLENKPLLIVLVMNNQSLDLLRFQINGLVFHMIYLVLATLVLTTQTGCANSNHTLFGYYVSFLSGVDARC